METNVQFWHELLKFLEDEYREAKKERDYAANRLEDLKTRPQNEELIAGYDESARQYGMKASLIDYFIKTIGSMRR